MQTKAVILYVEDNQDSREMIEIYFTCQGYKVITACDSAEALKKAQKDKFDLFMLDLKLPDRAGDDLALDLRQMQPSAPIVYYTASAFPSERQAAMSKCGEAYLVKPDSFEDIQETIENLVIASQIALKG